MDSWKWKKFGVDAMDSLSKKVEMIAMKVLELEERIDDLEHGVRKYG